MIGENSQEMSIHSNINSHMDDIFVGSQSSAKKSKSKKSKKRNNKNSMKLSSFLEVAEHLSLNKNVIKNPPNMNKKKADPISNKNEIKSAAVLSFHSIQEQQKKDSAEHARKQKEEEQEIKKQELFSKKVKPIINENIPRKNKKSTAQEILNQLHNAHLNSILPLQSLNNQNTKYFNTGGSRTNDILLSLVSEYANNHLFGGNTGGSLLPTLLNVQRQQQLQQIQLQLQIQQQQQSQRNTIQQQLAAMANAQILRSANVQSLVSGIILFFIVF